MLISLSNGHFVSQPHPAVHVPQLDVAMFTRAHLFFPLNMLFKACRTSVWCHCGHLQQGSWNPPYTTAHGTGLPPIGNVRAACAGTRAHQDRG